MEPVSSIADPYAGPSSSPGPGGFADFRSEAPFGEDRPEPGVAEQYRALVGRTKDRVTMDFEPDSTRPIKYVSVFGKVMDSEELLQHDGGKELLAIINANRKGRRGFAEAVTDFKSTDYAVLPGMENLDTGTGPLSLSVIRRMPDILKRIQEDYPVSDNERVLARLYQADMERKSQQGVGGIVGDFVRSMPAFGTRMWLEGKAIQFGAEAVIPGAGEAAMAGSVLKDVAEVGEMTLAARRARLALEALKGSAEQVKAATTTVEAAEAAAKAREVLMVGRLGKYAGADSKAQLEAVQAVRYAFYAKRAEAASASHNFFARGVARANNSILGAVAGTSEAHVAELAKMKWYQVASRGAEQATVGAIYQGSMYAGLDIAGQSLANVAAGQGPLDGRAAADKRLAAAMTGDERLGKYAEALAMGDVFRSYITLKSGEGLGNIADGLVGRPVKSILGSVTPKQWKDYGDMITKRYGDASRMRANVTGFGQEAVERGLEGGAKEAARAKGVTAFGWWMMNHMAENNVDASRAWEVLRGMGYTGWKDMMLLSAEGRFVGGLYGAEGGEPGLRQAWEQFKQGPDELMGDAIAFALPSIGVLGLAHLGSSKYLGGRGSIMKEQVNNVVDYLDLYKQGNGINVVEDNEGGLAIHREKQARADGTMPLTEGIASREKAIDAVEAGAAAYVQPKGEMKAFQRAAQGVVKMAQFIITADPSHMWSPSQQLFNAGIHEDIYRIAAREKDAIIKEHPRQKAIDAGRDPDAADVVDISHAKAMADPEVQKAVRERIGSLLDEIQASRGAASITRKEFDKLLEGADARAVANKLHKAEEDGLIYKVDLGGGHFYYSRAVDGKPEEQAAKDAVDAAAKRVLQRIGFGTDRFLEEGPVTRGDDGTSGGIRLDAGMKPTDDMAVEYLRKTGRGFASQEEINFARNETLPRLQAMDRQKLFQTSTGRFAAVMDGGKLRLHPMDGRAIEFSKRPENGSLKTDRFENADQAFGKLGAMGLDPSPLEVPVYVVDHRANLAESPSRLLREHWTGVYESEKAAEAAYSEYLRAKKAVETAGPKNEAAMKMAKEVLREVQARDELLFWSLGEQQNALGRAVMLRGKKYYRQEIGGLNYPDKIVTTMPTKMRGGRSLAHSAEEFREQRRRVSGKYDEAGRPLMHPTEIAAFSKAADIAGRVRDNPESSKNEVRDAEKLVAMFSVASPHLNLDAYSKLSLMLEGWADHSAIHGQDWAMSAGLAAVRRQIASDPEALAAMAAFRLYDHRDVRGNYGETSQVRWEDMPPGYARGWQTSDKVTERPMDLISKMAADKLDQQSYDKITGAAEAKEVPPKKAEAKKPATKKTEEAPPRVVKSSDPAENAGLSKEQTDELARQVMGPDDSALFPERSNSTVELTPEDAGFKDAEDFRKAFEKRSEELKDMTEEEFLRTQYCANGMDVKAAKAAEKAKEPAKKPARKPRGE